MGARIWDASTVAALDVLHYRHEKRGKNVEAIGVLAERAGLSIRAVRYCEGFGLAVPLTR